jgi:hypothetical protein
VGRVAALATILVELLMIAWLSSPSATREGLARERGVNLEATRGQPRVWLVAHIDSKSQPIPTAVRTLGFLLLCAGLLMATAVAPAAHSAAPVIAIAVTGGFGGLLLSVAWVGSASHGAADNASGVAAVLSAAQLTSRDLGVLITDGEELALAGATAWVQGKPPGTAINCDTVDDAGQFVAMRYGLAELADRAVHGAGETGIAVKGMRPLPGVLTDSVAFHQAKWRTVTLSRGTIRTLMKIHTRRDSLDNLRGTAIPDAARILARLVEELA